MKSCAVLVIHGGGWSAGNRKQCYPLNNYLASKGYLVASMEYRLAPEFKWPCALQDVEAAVEYLTKTTTAFPPCKQLCLLGRSAGGHLALVAGFSFKNPAIAGVVSFYAPTHLAFEYSRYCRVLDYKVIYRFILIINLLRKLWMIFLDFLLLTILKYIKNHLLFILFTQMFHQYYFYTEILILWFRFVTLTGWLISLMLQTRHVNWLQFPLLRTAPITTLMGFLDKLLHGL